MQNCTRQLAMQSCTLCLYVRCGTSLKSIWKIYRKIYRFMNYIYKSFLQFCLWYEILLNFTVYIINVQDCTCNSVNNLIILSHSHHKNDLPHFYVYFLYVTVAKSYELLSNRTVITITSCFLTVTTCRILLPDSYKILRWRLLLKFKLNSSRHLTTFFGPSFPSSTFYNVKITFRYICQNIHRKYFENKIINCVFYNLVPGLLAFLIGNKPWEWGRWFLVLIKVAWRILFYIIYFNPISHGLSVVLILLYLWW